MSYPDQDDGYSFNYNMYNHTLGVHHVVHPYQLNHYQASEGNNTSSETVSYLHL